MTGSGRTSAGMAERPCADDPQHAHLILRSADGSPDSRSIATADREAFAGNDPGCGLELELCRLVPGARVSKKQASHAGADDVVGDVCWPV
jgi:hypothetical protein